MSKSLDDLLPEVRAKAEALLDGAELQGTLLRVTQTRRTEAEQTALYAKGRTAPGEPCRHQGDRQPRPVGTCPTHPIGLRVTNAQHGYSWHSFGRAFDVAIVTYAGDQTPGDLYDGPWEQIGALGESLGLEWGGRWTPKFRDMPHFQDRGGLTLAQARAADQIEALA